MRIFECLFGMGFCTVTSFFYMWSPFGLMLLGCTLVFEVLAMHEAFRVSEL